MRLLCDSHQTHVFVRNVVLGVLFDQGKEYGSEWVAKKVAGRAEALAAQVSGKASQAVLRWVTATRVALPASFVIGGVPEVVKKKWESAQDLKDEQEAIRKAKDQLSRPVSGSHHKSQ